MRIIEADLNKLKEKINLMGSLTQDAIEQTVKALVERNTKLSEEVIIADDKIDTLENEIDKLEYRPLPGPKFIVNYETIRNAIMDKYVKN